MHKFDTFTAAIHVTLRIPVDVATFGGISLVASELNQVESQRKNSVLLASKQVFAKQRGYRLLAFEVRSPPEASVLADPSWLAVYIGLVALGVSCLQLLGSYSKVKSGAKELAADFGSLKRTAIQKSSEIVESLGKLSEAQRRDLLLGIEIYITAASDTIEKAENIALRATRFASILRRQGNSPKLEVSVEPTPDSDA